MRMKWLSSWLMNSGTAHTISRETNTWSSGNRCNGSVLCTIKGAYGNRAAFRCVVNRNLCIELIKVNIPGSDIDIAVYGCAKFDLFSDSLNEDLWSLLKLDIINMEDKYLSSELISEIEKDGIVLYEKV